MSWNRAAAAVATGIRSIPTNKMNLKRPPSYSDSFYFLQEGQGGQGSQGGPRTPTFVLLTPSPSIGGDLNLQRGEARKAGFPVVTRVPGTCPQATAIFVIKGSIHLLFISAFETAFYFLYVNRSENQGILDTLNTYYDPLIANCGSTWSNSTKALVAELLTYYGLNRTLIDAKGVAAADQRAHYNTNLLILSSAYSAICLGVLGLTTGLAFWKKWGIQWREILIESGLFILLLGLYEVFFFRTIIYEYKTISTPELDQYLLDGVAECSLGA